MLTLMNDLPSGTVGARVNGKLTGKDFEDVLIPAVEEALTDNNKINMLMEFDDDFSGLEASAIWDDAKMGLKHWRAWDKIAVITDKPWLTRTMKAVGTLFPSHTEVYLPDQKDLACRWVTGTPSATSSTTTTDSSTDTIDDIDQSRDDINQNRDDTNRNRDDNI